MVEPTRRLLQIFDEFGAKLTIMADVAEIIRFKEYFQKTGRDKFFFQEIEAQLQDAMRQGHDVQLHIHSSYFRAHYDNDRWVQDWSEYDFAMLAVDRMDWMVKQGKEYLESLLKPIDPDYQCDVFRAANWSVSPSKNVVDVLEKNGFRIDTSVFKYGNRTGHVNFDYSSAVSELLPWRVNADDICARDNQGALWEFPIYCERRSIPSFVTVNRIRRSIIGRAHQLSGTDNSAVTSNVHSSRSEKNRLKKAFGLHAWKADFNQCTGRQLTSALIRAEDNFKNNNTLLPFVLIGHSKLFSYYNERSLRPFLTYVENNPERFKFGKFSDFCLSSHFVQKTTDHHVDAI